MLMVKSRFTERKNKGKQVKHEAGLMDDILIVDDDPIVRHFLRRMLCMQGYTCTEAAHGHDAIEHLRSHRPCLIITDYQMPEMTGMQFLECIAELLRDSVIPVILLIRNEDDDVSEQAKKLGVQTILRKPLDYRGISSAVEAVLS